MVVADSSVQCPWHLTKQFSRYVTLLAPDLDEEPPLLELCIADMKDPRFDPKDYTEHEIVLERKPQELRQRVFELAFKTLLHAAPTQVTGSAPAIIRVCRLTGR